MPGAPQFDDEFRERFRELLVWRRDVRLFQRARLPRGIVEELLGPHVWLLPWAANLALCQVTAPERRGQSGGSSSERFGGLWLVRRRQARLTRD